MRKVTMIAALLLSVIMFFHSDISVEDEVVYAGNVTVHNVVPEPIFIDASPIVTIKPLEEEEESLLPYEDISLIALVTMAEAEGECEDGKRLVIDAILNRMDSEHFPDNVYDVIYQRNQELLSRTNTDVIFFTAGEYSKYGVPMFQLGNHYFSSYE